MKLNYKNILLAVSLLNLFACASQQQLTDSESIGVVSDSIEPATIVDIEESSPYRYRINVGDRLEVRFFRQLEYSSAVTVNLDGTVSLPFLPVVHVEGKTIEEVTSLLETEYARLSDNSPKPSDKQYLISIGDVLDIKFPYIDEYSGQAKVRLDGKISLPLIGAVIAEGITPETLQQRLKKRYSAHLQNPVVVVSVTDANSDFVFAEGKYHRVVRPEMQTLYVSLASMTTPKVFVGGEVKSPGAIAFEPTLTSLQAILSVGGTTSKSELKNVIILRKGADNKPKYIVRNLVADIKGNTNVMGRAITNDLKLRPFDIVIVPKTAISKVSDALNAYLFDLFPMIRNSSVGFNYQIGTSKIEQDTNLIETTNN